jgi:hypothetical protein
MKCKNEWRKNGQVLDGIVVLNYPGSADMLCPTKLGVF